MPLFLTIIIGAILLGQLYIALMPGKGMSRRIIIAMRKEQKEWIEKRAAEVDEETLQEYEAWKRTRKKHDREEYYNANREKMGEFPIGSLEYYIEENSRGSLQIIREKYEETPDFRRIIYTIIFIAPFILFYNLVFS